MIRTLLQRMGDKWVARKYMKRLGLTHSREDLARRHRATAHRAPRINYRDIRRGT